MHLRQADNQRCLRVDGAADDTLNRANELSRGEDRIVTKMRHGGMRTGAGKAKLEVVHGRHHRSDARRDGANRQAWPIVDRVHRRHRETIQQAIIDHPHAAAFILLGGLENEVENPVEVRLLAQQLRGTEQHRSVAVMAARMHDPLVPGGVKLAGTLDDRQRVQLGAKADGALGGTAAQHTDDTGAADALMNLEAERTQLVGDKARGLMFVKAEFRIGVDAMAPADDLRRDRGDRVVVQHLWWPSASCMAACVGRKGGDNLEPD